MQKRIKLDVETLRVDSFEAGSGIPLRGTVHGNWAPRNDDPTNLGTNIIACPGGSTGSCGNEDSQTGCVDYSVNGPCSYNVTECDV